MRDLRFPTPEEEAEFTAYFKAECERKEALSDLFYDLEEREREVPKPPAKQPKYKKKYYGSAQVVKKLGDRVTLAKESGKILGDIYVGRELCACALVDDVYDGKFGFRDGEWRIISIFFIGSDLSPENNQSLN